MGPVGNEILDPTKMEKDSVLEVCRLHAEYFSKCGVKCVIRCNEPKYDAEMLVFIFKL